MTRRTTLDSFGSLLDLWPVARRTAADSEVLDAELADEIEKAADNNFNLLLGYATSLKLGDFGFIESARVVEIKAELLAMSLKVAPAVPPGLRGIQRDRAVLARDRYVAANRQAGILAAEHEA